MAIQLDQVEFANEAFYLAFEAKDFSAMAHLWSEQTGCVCLHPGWAALVGREAVLDSWRNILANPEQGQVSFYGAQISQMSDSTALVVCYERAGDSIMVATNVFIEEDERPRLFGHQAGFCARPPS